MNEANFSRQTLIFAYRWFFNSFAIWVLVALFGKISGEYNIGIFFVAGLIFSVINATLKPIITILSLPAILMTLGLFTLIVNGFIVWLSLLLAPQVSMTFWNSVAAGVVMSLLNYSIGGFFEEIYNKEKK